MAKLLYFGSHISENIIEDKGSGFIVCLNVPVARTGWQTYSGEELGEEVQKVHDIKPTDRIKVYRSPEEVFSKETMASFEGMPVTDNHPKGGRFVNSENFKELVCGHGQNVRKGGEISKGDEEELLADLAVQYKPLVKDVLEDRKREISCGYDYKLRLRPDGNFEQYEIRGNHFAVVPKGRAGDKMRINDSAFPEEEEKTMPENVAPVKPAGMSWKKFLMGLGIKVFATDAKPEEVAEAQDELRKEEGAMPEQKKGLSEEELKAKDEELTEREKKLAEREEDSKKRAEDARRAEDERKAADKRKTEDSHRADDDDDKHPDGCRCQDCAMDKKGKDSKRGKDSKGRDAKIAKLRKMLDDFLSEEEEEPEHAEDKKGKDKRVDDKKTGDDDKDDKGEVVEPADNPAEDKKGMDGLDPIPAVTAKEETKNPIPGADAALDVLRETRAIVAKSGDKMLIAKWNRARDLALDPKSATTRDAYTALAELEARATDADPDTSAEDRAKAYQENLNKSNSRARKEN